ncbi:hypothetical protein BC938DRAFT_479480, partial [Jimgerdemannia flammicorona]
MSQQELLEKRRRRRAEKILAGAGDRLTRITKTAHGPETADALGDRPITPSPAVTEERLKASTSSSGRSLSSPTPSPSTSTTSIRSIPISPSGPSPRPSSSYTLSSSAPSPRPSTSYTTGFSTPPALTPSSSLPTQSIPLTRNPSLNTSQPRQRPGTTRRASDADPDDSLGAPSTQSVPRVPLVPAEHFRTETPDELAQVRIYQEMMASMGMIPQGGFPPGFFPPGPTTPGATTPNPASMPDMLSGFPFPSASGSPFGFAGGPLGSLLLQAMTGNFGQPNVPRAQDETTRWWTLVHFVTMVVLGLWVISGQWATGAKELARLVWYSPYVPFGSTGDASEAVAGVVGTVGWDGLARR